MGKQKKLLWKLFQSHLVIALLSLITVALFASQSLRYFYIGQTRDDLMIRAELFKKIMSEEPSHRNANEINRLCRETGSSIGTRITVVLSDGVVVGDSDENFKLMENHGDRPEIKTALSGEVGMSTRYSYTLKKDLMYVAVPIVQDSFIIGVVRTSKPVASVASTLRGIYVKITSAVMIIALIAAIASLIASRWMNSTINEMVQGVENFACGDLDFRISVSGITEFETLAEGMNSMAAQLTERIHTISEQRNEIEAILSGMVEAVIAVDTDERIIEYNQAAEKLFRIYPVNARDKHIHEIIQNTYILSFVAKVLSGQELLEDEIVFHGEDEYVLHVHGTQLHDKNRARIGAVIVFNDITRLKKLESVRRDFVANVSHELKTPITSIIGFVETLKDGAIEDTANRQRFLGIILKHSKRLNSIVEDLLSLSRIEQETEKGVIVFEKNNVCTILSSAIALYETQAQDKRITIAHECDNTFINGNSSLLVHAVGNLIDNAIKYCEEKSHISVKTLQKGTSVIIEVKDNGCGIPQEHTSRIFERFYRVDKGRSRDLGGTGLGLAIVKHIIIAHDGNISVESKPGKESTFTITLPAV